MDLQLTDQVVFVAGSSRGIGRAIAAALLDEGARIVLTGRDEASLKSTHAELATPTTQDRILSIRGDFSDPATIDKALARTLQHFGRIDHLIANLGTGSGKPGWNQPPEEWERLFELNFFASVRLSQAVLPHLLRNLSSDHEITPGEPPGDHEKPPVTPPQIRGSILYISSIVGLEATPAPLPYSAAKAALLNYMKNLARQLGPQRIRVNAIAPGNIYFPGGSWQRHIHDRPEAVDSMLQTEVPLQRFGAPADIATLATYLCSPLAAFATGACFVMDGGQTRTI